MGEWESEERKFWNTNSATWRESREKDLIFSGEIIHRHTMRTRQKRELIVGNLGSMNLGAEYSCLQLLPEPWALKPEL